MSTDPNDSPVGLGNLGRSKLTLGSLAQSARTKQIRQARLILYVIGGLNLVGGLLAMIGTAVAAANAPQAPDPEVVNTVQVIAIVSMAIGGAYVVLGMLTKRYPVPSTILALIIQTTMIALNLLGAELETLPKLIIPVLIEIALIRSVQAAIAYQREENAARLMADPLS